MKKETDTEQKILRSAEEVFFEEGFEGARMQAIADRAAMNKALLHYYFRSKERLFDAVFAEALRRFVPPVIATLESDAPVPERIRSFVDAYFDMARKSPFLPRFVIIEMHRDPKRFGRLMDSHSGLSIARLQEQLDREAGRGELRPFDAAQLLVNLLALCAFPFVASRAMQALTGKPDDEYRRLLEERRALIPQWIEEMLKP